MTKHTPGPWHARGQGIYIDGEPGDDYEEIYEHARAHENMPGGISAAEADANAKLIAAAPDLLEAVRQLLGALDLTLDVYYDPNLEDHRREDGELSAIQAVETAQAEARAILARATSE